jgi:hypothetical protein
MAFCPECGKAAPAGAETCASCGFGLTPDGKKGAARFKGTVIMSATVGKPAEPSKRNTAASKPLAAARPGARGKSKQHLKATMIGAGGMARSAAGSARDEPAVIKTPIVQAVVVNSPIVDAVEVETLDRATTPGVPSIPSVIVDAEPLPPSPLPDHPSVARADDDAWLRRQAGFSAAPRARFEQAHDYLPGDPMAPQPTAASRSSPRLLLNDEAMRNVDDRSWMYWAVCAVIAVTAAVLAFGLF